MSIIIEDGNTKKHISPFDFEEEYEDITMPSKSSISTKQKERRFQSKVEVFAYDMNPLKEEKYMYVGEFYTTCDMTEDEIDRHIIHMIAEKFQRSPVELQGLFFYVKAANRWCLWTGIERINFLSKESLIEYWKIAKEKGFPSNPGAYYELPTSKVKFRSTLYALDQPNDTNDKLAELVFLYIPWNEDFCSNKYIQEAWENAFNHFHYLYDEAKRLQIEFQAKTVKINEWVYLFIFSPDRMKNFPTLTQKLIYTNPFSYPVETFNYIITEQKNPETGYRLVESSPNLSNLVERITNQHNNKVNTFLEKQKAEAIKLVKEEEEQIETPSTIALDYFEQKAKDAEKQVEELTLDLKQAQEKYDQLLDDHELLKKKHVALVTLYDELKTELREEKNKTAQVIAEKDNLKKEYDEIVKGMNRNAFEVVKTSYDALEEMQIDSNPVALNKLTKKELTEMRRTINSLERLYQSMCNKD